MSKRATTLLTMAAVAALAAPSSAQSISEQFRAVKRAVEHAATVRYQPGGETQTDRSTRTVKISANGDIDISNIAGDITITRGGGSNATIEIVKTARARTAAEAKEMLGQVQVVVEERPGRVEIQTRYPQQRNAWMGWGNRRGTNVSVAFTITAPAGVRIAAKSVAGSVKVSGIKGELTLEAVSGSVRVSDAGRISSAKSLAGGVEILDSRLDGVLEVSSVAGPVVLRHVRVRRIEAGSVSGGLTLEDVECDRAELTSFSGTVEFTGPLARGGRYEMKSHTGDVRITVTGGAGFEFDATTFSGSLRSDLPLTNRAAERPERRMTRRSLQGTSGDGGAVLELSTFSGNVVISKR